ncbi:MAG TPA: glycine zipper family protein [Polyangiaceae bacterium]|nr:glycine zipper family protein [Polyangiaceae bacterium]
MPVLLAAILAFPAVVFTVMLALAILYWLFVVVGAVDIDSFGGADDAIEGAAGAAKGAMEGAVGAAKGAMEGVHDGLDVDGIDAGDPDGALAGISNVLKLGSAPVTVVYSLFALFGWLLTSLFAVTFGVPGALVGIGVMLGSAIVSLLLTSIAIRPLAPIFATKAAKKSADIVGKIATISTGQVTMKFGQATVADGGAGLSLQVRAEPGSDLKRGDKVVLVYWDKDLEAFHVEKLPSHDEVLLSDGPRTRVENLASDLDTDDAPAQKKRGSL